ncbi:MAG: glyoxalase [Crocinitomicaceae bacterium]
MEGKKLLRPEIKTLNDNSSENEIFQNTVLRPIIKLQHQLLIALTKQKINSLQINFQELSDEKQHLTIENLILKDLTFKATLVGSIIGLFEIDEIDFYLAKQKEINKRILFIIQKRLSENRDQF